MPIIHICNWPHASIEASTREHRESLWQIAVALALRDACVAAQVPGITGVDLVTVVFDGPSILPDDRLLVISVEGLFERPDRTPEVRQRLAHHLGGAALRHLTREGETWRVEVLIHRFHPDVDGFWSGNAVVVGEHP